MTSFTLPRRALVLAAIATSLLGSAASTRAQGPVYSVNIVGFQKVFSTAYYPPGTGGFFAEGDATFPGDATRPPAVMRGFAVQFATGVPVTSAGSSVVTVTSQGRCSGQISVDGGASFAGWTGACTGTLRLTPSSDGSGSYDTEMLSLSISSPTLPPTVKIRESPTLQSTGRCAVTQLTDGSSRIDSFFDVFTELSFDNGNTWTPQSSVASRCTLGAAAPELFAQTDFLPDPGTLRSLDNNEAPMAFAGTSALIRELAFARRGMNSNVRSTALLGVDRTVPGRATGEVSVDGGVSFTRFDVPAVAHMSDALRTNGGGVRTFDTEMLSLDLSITVGGSDGTTPGVTVMLRESPTRASTGKTSVRQLPDGNFLVGGFFDVFTELSIDGGATWAECDGARRRVMAPNAMPDAHLFSTNFFPPRGSLFDSEPTGVPTAYSSAVSVEAEVLSPRLRISPVARSIPMTPGMAMAVFVCQCTCDFLVKQSGSTVWEPVTAEGSVRVAVGDVDGDGVIETEMLSLDLVSGSGGGGGGGAGGSIMIRESPTRASTGKTSVSNIGSSGQDGVSISSFFDVFTELSLDGGTTWLAASARNNFQLGSLSVEDSYASDWLPPAGSVLRNELKERFKDGDIPTENDFANLIDSFVTDGTTGPIAIRRMQIGDPDFDLLRVAPPAPGSSVTFDQQTRVEIEYTRDGGGTWATLSCDATVTQRYTAVATFSDGRTDTEMLSMSLSGLPSGQPFLIRESPTRQSLGSTTITATNGGGHRIGSFFDIFVEVSIDDGATWLPATRAITFSESWASCRPIIASTDLLPTPGDLGEAPGGLGAQTASGRKHKAWLTSNFRLTSGGGSPPPPGGSVQATQVGSVSFLWQDSGDAGFSLVSAPITITTIYQDNIVELDEVFSISISGGTLPAGVMIRESPTRASRGPRQSTSLDGSRFAVSSFFDVFTEISVDGGATWEPTDLPIRLMLLPPVQKVTHTSPTFPPFQSLSQHYIATGNYADGSTARAFGTFSDGVLDPLPDGLAVFGSKKGYDYYQAQSQLRVTHAGSSFTASGPVHFVLDATRSLDDGAIMTFDTEMFVCDFGDATTGFMLRESPTKRSLGRTTIEPLANGTYRIGSFFDIFTEISFDGGATWSPSDGPLRLEARQVPLPIITLPPLPLLTVLPGKPASFHVACEPSLSALHFEWLKAGVPVVGAPDSPDLVIPAATLSQAGFYSCRVTNAGGSVVSSSAELRVINPFPPLAGKYNGLVSAPSPSAPSFSNSGFVAMTIGKTGAFSGVLCWGGLKYVLKGTLDVDGQATLTPPIIGTRPPPSVTILLDATGLHTSVTDGGSTSAGLAFRNTYTAKLNPTPHAGVYTITITHKAIPALPQGTGFCFVKVKPDGSVTIAGKTGDFTAFSAGAFLTADGTLPVYAIVSYPIKGGLTGTLRMRADEDEDCDGVMEWYKPAQPGIYYPGGFATSTSMGGARYIVPPVGTPILPFRAGPGNCRITLATDNPSVPLVKMLTVSPTNIVTVDSPGTDKLKVVLSSSKGTITGSFVDPATLKTHSFGGLIQQKTLTGAGTVKETMTTDTFDTQFFR